MEAGRRGAEGREIGGGGREIGGGGRKKGGWKQAGRDRLDEDRKALECSD